LSIRGSAPIAPETVEAFAHRLEAWAATLSEREQAILAAIVDAARDPLERARHRDPAELLSDAERAVLARLLDPPSTEP
jgi:hypothetical protein